MNKRRRNSILLAIILFSFCLGAVGGYYIIKSKIFRDHPVKHAIHSFIHGTEQSKGIWSIGIYKGTTPFNLEDSYEIKNPILTIADLHDVDAKFIADPFVMYDSGKFTIFFEVLNNKTNQGDIAYAESSDGKQWKYIGNALDEPFHISYPFVFKWESNYYMVPESHEDLSVRLYKSVTFPHKWEYMGNLLSGHDFVDPTLFFLNNKWWMFVSNNASSVLNIYYSDSLQMGWKAHPKNPIVKFNKHYARPAGRVFSFNNKYFRLAQDDDPYYGIQVFAFEIIEITDSTYREIRIEKPLIEKSNTGWNANGMHQLDLFLRDNFWYGVVDGKN